MRIYACMLILFLLLSCNKEPLKNTVSLIDGISDTRYYNSEIFTPGNLRLYGHWQFLYIYADVGIAGGPGKINPNYDFLEIKKYGIYGKVKVNQLFETGKIKIVAQDNAQLEIMLIPDGKDSLTNRSWYYITYANDSIIMTDASVGCGVLFNAFRKSN